MGGNRKRKKSKSSPENKDDPKRANMETRQKLSATKTPNTGNQHNLQQNQNQNQHLTDIGNSFIQNGQCYTPGQYVNQNQNQTCSTPMYNYPTIPMMNQASPSFQQACLPTALSNIANGDQFSALIQRLDNIDSKLTQLEKIQSSVNQITARLGQLDQRVSSIEDKIKGIEQSREFDSQSIEEMKLKQGEIDSFKGKLAEFEEQQKKMNSDIRRELTDLKGRSMRDNLLFFGIPEVRDRENRESDKECMEKVLEMIETKMEIIGARENIKLHRAHRIGRYNAQKTRPIVAKFAYFPDREEVRLKANKLERPLGVSQQFPPEVMEARKRLVPVMQEARRQNKEAYISGDKLYINGRLYREPGETAER